MEKTNMKKPKKRYESKFDVDVEIYKQKRLIAKLEQEAAKLESEINNMVKTARAEGENAAWMMEKVAIDRKKLKRILTRIDGIKEVKIPALGQTKAVIQTDVMPFMDDKSVTIQK